MKAEGFRFLTLGGLMAVALSLSPSCSAAAKGEITFSTAPTQSPAQTRKMYQPLADYLSQVTGKKVLLEPADSFLEYTNDMRKGMYDLLFDGPQFVSWRMGHLDHAPLAKLPGAIIFVVVVRDGSTVHKVSRLAGKRVCAFASPNLLTMGFLALFNNPARLPNMIAVKTFKGALDCVKDGKGVAAVMRNNFWKKRTPEQKLGFRLLYTSKIAFPNRTFSISKNIDQKTRDKIRAALLSKKGLKPAAPILTRFKVGKLVPAQGSEYKGLARLLKPIWGFN